MTSPTYQSSAVQAPAVLPAVLSERSYTRNGKRHLAGDHIPFSQGTLLNQAKRQSRDRFVSLVGDGKLTK